MIRADKIQAIPKTSPLYPESLKTLSDAPEVLYALGNTALLKTRSIAVVGSRRTATAALRWCAEETRALSKQFTVFTGTAEGGDGAAVEGALAGSGNIVCVLAGGFGSIPQGNLPILESVAKHGLLLALHDYETPVRKFSFEYRNKILAKCTEATLVVSGGENSGTLITAKWAKKFEKPVFALPYFPNSDTGAGCNALLKTGGILTENAADIFAYFHIADGDGESENTEEVTLSDDEKKVYDALCAETELHANALAGKTGIPVFKLRAILSALEVGGFVTPLGGNRYAAVKKR